MESNASTGRKISEEDSGLRSVSAIMCFAALLLCGCASTVNVPDELPASADLPKGYGTVIGSILMSAPTGASSIKQQKMVDSLKAKKCRATIRRWNPTEILPRASDYVGDEYTVFFEIDVEKRFIIRAPAGRYSLLKIAQIVPAVFGTGCSMEDVAKFDIREGKTTYIGQLTVLGGFKTEGEIRMMYAEGRAMALQIGDPGLPERFLNMRLSVTDAKQETLRGLGRDESGSAAGIGTELLMVRDEVYLWRAEVIPTPSPPGAPRHR